jgi:hypothetical protein
MVERVTGGADDGCDGDADEDGSLSRGGDSEERTRGMTAVTVTSDAEEGIGRGEAGTAGGAEGGEDREAAAAEAEAAAAAAAIAALDGRPTFLPEEDEDDAGCGEEEEDEADDDEAG